MSSAHKVYPGNNQCTKYRTCDTLYTKALAVFQWDLLLLVFDIVSYKIQLHIVLFCVLHEIDPVDEQVGKHLADIRCVVAQLELTAGHISCRKKK